MLKVDIFIGAEQEVVLMEVMPLLNSTVMAATISRDIFL
jgi:hypothetical protein